MLRELLVDQLWVSLLLVTFVYMLDYRLSVIGQRWFKRGADQHYDLGGSYELNPPFVDDIENERLVSVKHLIALARIWVFLGGLWWLVTRYWDLPEIFIGALGFFVLLQLPVHMRHTQNIVLFRFVATRGGVKGRARADRWLDLKVSAAVFWFFAAAYTVIWLIVGDAFFIGGAVGSLLTGARFWIFGDEHAEEGLPEPEKAEQT